MLFPGNNKLPNSCVEIAQLINVFGQTGPPPASPPPRLVRLFARLYEKSMYMVYMIFKRSEKFFNNIFLNQVSYFCSSHLNQFADILPCKNSPCPANRTLGGVTPPYTPPEVSPLVETTGATGASASLTFEAEGLAPPKNYK